MAGSGDTNPKGQDPVQRRGRASASAISKVSLPTSVKVPRGGTVSYARALEEAVALGSDYRHIFRSTPMDRVMIAKAGVSAVDAKSLFAALAIPSGALYDALQLSVSTLNRKAKTAERLPVDESERIVGLARLVGQVEVMVGESGNPDQFDAAAWTARWLTEPVAALGGMRPMDLMDTMEGQSMVSDTLARMQSGAYA